MDNLSGYLISLWSHPTLAPNNLRNILFWRVFIGGTDWRVLIFPFSSFPLFKLLGNYLIFRYSILIKWYKSSKNSLKKSRILHQSRQLLALFVVFYGSLGFTYLNFCRKLSLHGPSCNLLKSCLTLKFMRSGGNFKTWIQFRLRWWKNFIFYLFFA